MVERGGVPGAANSSHVAGADTYQRLAALKREVDPENAFHGNHNITPA